METTYLVLFFYIPCENSAKSVRVQHFKPTTDQKMRVGDKDNT